MTPMPVGIVASAHKSGGALSASYLQVTSDIADASSYTFTSQNLGTAASDRSIVVMISGRAAATTCTVSSITVGGVTATIDEQHYEADATTMTGAVIAHASVPTGTTGDVVVTWTGSMLRCTCALYRVTGASLAVTSSATKSASSTTVMTTVGSLVTTAGGFLAAAWALGANDYRVTWTGVTENYDLSVESAFSVSGGSAATSGASVTVSNTHSPNGGVYGMAAVAYEGA